MLLEENERLDDLQLNNLKIIQNKNLYNFTCDAVILANFIKTKHSDIYVDFCTGSGVIPILVNEKQNPKNVYGIEIQKQMYDLFVKNINLNNLTDKLKAINGDVKNIKDYFKSESVDVVSCNPPYIKDCNISNDNDCLTIARHEKLINLEQVISSASYILKNNGKFYIVHLASRLVELINILSKYKLEPKKMFFTYPSINKNAKLAIIECVKNGKSELKILPPLVTNDLDGNYIHNNFI